MALAVALQKAYGQHNLLHLLNVRKAGTGKSLEMNMVWGTGNRFRVVGSVGGVSRRKILLQREGQREKENIFR